MRQSLATLVLALTLAGCGAHPAMLTTTAVPTDVGTQAIAAANAPGLQITPPAIAPQPAGQGSTLKLVGEADLNDNQLMADAAETGYSVQDLSSRLGFAWKHAGVVRRTEAGYVLEVVTDKRHGFLWLKKTRTESQVTLKASQVLTQQLAKYLDKWVTVEGSIDADQVVVVDSVESKFFHDELKVGRVSGSVKTADGLALGDVKVDLKSAAGFVFSDLTDANGKLSIKHLEPGVYTLVMTHDGYQKLSGNLTIKSRKDLHIECALAALPTVAPAH